ncbi:hypothetical protein CEXT_192091, partial [Caerostris extrusa]
MMDRSNRASTSLQSTQFPETLNITLNSGTNSEPLKRQWTLEGENIEHHIEFWNELRTIKASMDSE